MLRERLKQRDYLYEKHYLFSEKSNNKVAIGPRSNDNKNQFSPVLPFPCASPALINERVPHPTKY